MVYIRRHLLSVILVFVSTLGIYLILNSVVPVAEPRLAPAPKKSNNPQKEILNFVAIGDSLTEGVGDTTKSGGYVPLLKQEISEETGIDAIQTDNFGKAGDRSDQILKRIKESKEIQSALKKADFITLTVGGNDLMKVIKTEFLNDISFETFDKPKDKFKKQLESLLKEIRKYNRKAPIYQMGIYNPFYLSFKELDEMQEIVTLWNTAAKQVIDKDDHAFFIPINDLLYKGLDGEVGVGAQESEALTTSSMGRARTSSSTSSTTTSSSNPSLNNLISDADNFHPNNLGYQIMANAFNDKMMMSKKEWLDK